MAARKRVAIQTRLFTEHTMRCLSISLPSVLLGMATPTHGCDPSDRWLQAGSVRCRCARALCARVWYCIHRTRFGYIPGLLSSRPLPPSRSASSAHTFSFLFCFSMLTCTRSCWGVVARPNVLDARWNLGCFRWIAETCTLMATHACTHIHGGVNTHTHTHTHTPATTSHSSSHPLFLFAQVEVSDCSKALPVLNAWLGLMHGTADGDAPVMECNNANWVSTHTHHLYKISVW